MTTEEKVQRVRIYIRERDRWEGQPLHLALLTRLQREGATGATALRGLAGFGPSYRLRVTNSADMSEQPPVVIEWIDRAERVARVLPLLDDMLPNALTTIEDVGIYRAALRAGGAFTAERAVGDYMRNTVATVGPDDRTLALVDTLLTHDQPLLPVLDAQRRVLGVVASVDLMQRASLPVPLRILRVVPQAVRAPLLEGLADLPAAAIMTSEPRSIYRGAPVPQALVTMLEWSFNALPVLNREGLFEGLLDRWGVLQAALDATQRRSSAVRDAEPATTIELMMQRVVAQTPVTSSLSAILTQLLATPQRYIVLVDAAQRVQGSLTDVGALAGLQGDEQIALLAALRGEHVTLPGNEQGPETLMERETHALHPNQTIHEAVERFVGLQLERVCVVDDEGKLVGVVTRGGLLRALSQAT